MPGTFVLKPIEANLTHSTEFLTSMNPYCSVLSGTSRFQGEVCNKGGKHPHWNDIFTLPAIDQRTAVVEVLDKDLITRNDHIGTCLIDLREVKSMGHVSKWYPLYHKKKPAGEILLEAVFQPDASSSLIGQGSTFQNETIGMTQHNLVQGGLSTTTSVVNEVSGLHTGAHMYAEQRSVVEPHTFLKDVDVVETRSVLKEIEVMEPHKVMKDVLVTEAVPVTKQIEVTEPHVVMKEIDVIEPRVVTKQIKVIENVSVRREVEVIEPRTVMMEVETMEPHTFTRQVEVTENVPVMRTVEVTEPFTIRKSVEFVEPITTTQTITKEIQQPVIVNERTTTTVGPATLVREEALLRQERFVGEQRFVGQEGLLEQERLHFEQQTLQGDLGSQMGGQYSTSQFTSQKGSEIFPRGYISPQP
jgi:hypothetical protein